MLKRILASVLSITSCAWAGPDIVINDFEKGDYGDWKATGDAFGAAPARGTLANQQTVGGFEGNGLVNSYLKGDGTQGTLTSPPLTVERDFINFLIGGGAHEGRTCINLLHDGKVVRTATGQEAETLDWHTWDVSELKGKSVQLQIVDKHNGGWGHINVDQITQSDERKSEPISTAEFYNETYRPQFHFTAPRGWLNDPNGMVYYDGEYHLFYQYNPSGTNWIAELSWGHAVSKDMLHWEHLPPAIPPIKLPNGKVAGAWSGTGFVDFDNSAGFQKGDKPPLMVAWTAIHLGQCLAFSNDRGRTFTLYEKNPILPFADPKKTDWDRDPKIFRHEPTKKWIMVLSITGKGFEFYSSADLKSWTLESTFKELWECPEFFELPVDQDQNNKKWIIWDAASKYYIGTFDGKAFTPESGPHILDQGKNYYAPQTFSNAPGNDTSRIAITWMRGGRYSGMPFNQQMGIPSVIMLRKLSEGLRLVKLPIQQIETLRASSKKWTNVSLNDQTNPLADVKDELLDIEAEFALDPKAEITLTLRGQQIWYSNGQLTVLGKSVPLKPANNRLQLRVLLDRTSMEVFANEGSVSMSSCFLPRSKEKGFNLSAKNGTATATSLSVNTLRSVWK